MYIKTLTVTALNSYIKKTLDNDFILSNLSVKGEISNFKRHSSGHVYFSLKDESSKINCVMFNDCASSLKFNPENGMMVEVKGRISVYLKEGVYQLYVNEMTRQGLGDLYAAYIELKTKLDKEGLFKEEHKKPLPLYPKTVGIITSPTGAAIKDIIRVSRRRNKFIDIIIYPSQVQGEKASKNIIEGINYFEREKNVDAVIIARGGGSIEELWCFNDETLARSIYNANIPIVTGIGHEIDFTIADFVGDKRASTPSAAAEIVFSNYEDIFRGIKVYESKLKEKVANKLKYKKRELDFLKHSLELNSPFNFLVNQYKYIEDSKLKLMSAMESKVNGEKENLKNLNSLLNAHNPLNLLSKGYSVIESNEGKVIKSIEDFNDEDFNIILKDGKIRARKIK